MIYQNIIPAIIPDTQTQLAERLREVRHEVRTVQVDVMDGSYTPNPSWPYEGVSHESFEGGGVELPFWQELEIEIDLMVREPESHVRNWSLAGASRIIAHIESTDRMNEVIDTCLETHTEVALAIKPETDAAMLEPYLEHPRFVQVMGSAEIGKHGVALSDAARAQVRTIHKRWPELLIGVDIGVNEATIPTLLEAGARRFAAGSAIFRSGDAVGAYRTLTALTETS